MRGCGDPSPISQAAPDSSPVNGGARPLHPPPFTGEVAAKPTEGGRTLWIAPSGRFAATSPARGAGTARLALAACLLLAACGFQPLYAPSPTVAAQGGLGEIRVAPINGRVGYFLGQGLERMLPGQGAQARTLVVEVQTTFQPLAVRVDGSAARTDLIGVARYRLDGADPSAAPLSGEVRATVSYDLLDQPFGDVAAQTDAEERLASVLAERIRTELVLRQRAAAQAAQ
jgi:LPS-assembly lipoprotein